MKFQRIAMAVILLFVATLASAQTPAPNPNPISSFNRIMYAGVKNFLVKSAEKVPEEHYSFKPTEAVRSFGQIIGHVADAQYRFCSIVLGEKNPAPQIEKTKTTKAELTAALKEAFAYCDQAYNTMTDETAAQTVKMFGTDATKVGVLTVNSVHTIEHYGNLVTYMRMKNIVPPSSEPGGTQPPPVK